MKELERRFLKTAELKLETRDEDSGDKKIRGYAAVFNQWTDIGGAFREQVAPGAFKKTIKDGDVRALFNHDANYVLGRSLSGTLELREDDKGLYMEIDPPNSSWSRDLQASMERGDISQSSFSFVPVKTDDDYNADTRVLREVRLYDVSVVTYPAYPTTSANVRSLFSKGNKEDEARAEELEELFNKLRSGAELSDKETQLLRSFLPEDKSKPGNPHFEPGQPGSAHSPRVKALLAECV